MFDTSATAHDLNVDNGTFVVDGSASRVGIGTSSPSEKLHVQGDGADILITDAAGGEMAKIGSTGSNNGIIDLKNSSHASKVVLNTNGDSYFTGGNVGIGTNSPSSFNALADNLVVGTTSGSNGISIVGATNGNSSIYFADGTSGAAQQLAGYVQYSHGSDALIFGSGGGNEAMRIDSSGNMQVGTTQTFPAYNNVVGAEVGGFGMLSASRTGAESIQLNRRTNDGTIALFKKDGTDIGLIGTSTGDLVIGTAAAALKFRDGDQDIIPWNGTTNGTNNGNYDLGDASNKFKDGYFANSLYVGTNNSFFRENVIRFKSSGAAYFDHETVGQNFIFRVSNSSSFDTTALTIASTGTVAVGGTTVFNNSGVLQSAALSGTYSNPVNFSHSSLELSGHMFFNEFSSGRHYIHFKTAASTNQIDWRIQTNSTNNTIHSWTNTLASFATSMSVSGNLTVTGTLNSISTTKSASGNRWGILPEVEGNGVMEIGRYLDFHVTDGDTSDYGARFDYDGSKMILTQPLTVVGSISPSTDNTNDLGSTSLRWRNIYTADLHLSNEGSKNDIDGTSGNWTIQEGETDLYIINNKSGKKYKFALEEID